MLEAIVYDSSKGTLAILDQLLVPHETKYREILSCEDAWDAIFKMQVRGAPAIAIVGLLSLNIELRGNKHLESGSVDSVETFIQFVSSKCNYLCTARPTAVNIRRECNRLLDLLKLSAQSTSGSTIEQLVSIGVNFIDNLLQEDLATNKLLGAKGGEHLLETLKKDKLCILTHCNTGSLATSGYGTALGVIRYLHSLGKIDTVYCCETRPYNQGSRLTAYELVCENIPAKLITDSMAAFAMAKGKIDAVITGADRVVANGDTANKIGTYSHAVNAFYHKIPFYIASPISTIDLKLKTGDQIVIEERPSNELKQIAGIFLAPESIDTWNPSFDVTPAHLITGIITEKGVVPPADLNQLF